MSGPTVSIKCSQCGQTGTIRQRDVNRLKRPWLCPACRSLPEHNPNWRGGISTQYYRYKRESVARYPERNAARVELYHAIRAGRITRQPCEVCGKRPAQAHHESYDKPLAVRWLCRKHHQLEHSKGH